MLKETRVKKRIERAKLKGYENIQQDFDEIKPENIHFLIRYREEEFVVFIDSELELDWVTSLSYDAKIEDKVSREKLLSLACILQHDHNVTRLTRNQKELFGRLLGEAVVQILIADYEAAKGLIEEAKKYIKMREFELSRKWQVLSGFIGILTIFILLVVINKYQVKLSECLSISPSYIKLLGYSFFGAVGALFSIVQKSGNRKIDCEAGVTLIAIDILAKLIIGVVSGFIILCFFQLDMVFANFKGNGNSHIGSILVSFIAGFSERLIPSIVSKFEDDSTRKEVADSSEA
jgi:hypothetical protein